MSSPERRSWLIRKKKGGNLPFDSPEASIIGPDTDVVGVIPEQREIDLRATLQEIAAFVVPDSDADCRLDLEDAIDRARVALKEKEKLDG